MLVCEDTDQGYVRLPRQSRLIRPGECLVLNRFFQLWSVSSQSGTFFEKKIANILSVGYLDTDRVFTVYHSKKGRGAIRSNG